MLCAISFRRCENRLAPLRIDPPVFLQHWAGRTNGALAGTRKATLRDFHIPMDNCRIHNSKFKKGKSNETRLIRWDHPRYSPDIAPSDFWFFEWSKREMKGQAFSSREPVKTFLLEMWATMDSGQLFGVFNKWMKRLEYVIKSGGEHYTHQKRFALIVCLFAKIERRSTTL
jgi:hypothetical protein